MTINELIQEAVRERVEGEYNKGLDTAWRLAKEILVDNEDKEVLLCAIINSKKNFKPTKDNKTLSAQGPSNAVNSTLTLRFKDGTERNYTEDEI